VDNVGSTRGGAENNEYLGRKTWRFEISCLT